MLLDKRSMSISSLLLDTVGSPKDSAVMLKDQEEPGQWQHRPHVGLCELYQDSGPHLGETQAYFSLLSGSREKSQLPTGAEGSVRQWPCPQAQQQQHRPQGGLLTVSGCHLGLSPLIPLRPIFESLPESRNGARHHFQNGI
jgi:hypothetical protein